jgi:hypothetical protein
MAAPYQPVYHFTAASGFDASGLPTGLAFTGPERLFDFQRRASPLQPHRQLLEIEQLACGEVDLPYDDQLGQVQVPVLYVGAGGGFGEEGLPSLSLLGSTDVSSLLVSAFPPELRILDYGHADLWLAEDAGARAWTPILAWLQAR